MTVKLMTLCENTSGKAGFLAEWGWSIFIQVENMNILFDTGGGFSAVRNADKFGINLKSIDKIILSHAHWDHTGGLRDFLQRAQHPEVIMHPAIWKPKYKKSAKDKNPTYRGIPFAKEELERWANFVFSQKPVQISENVMTTGEIPQKTEFETIESHFLIKTGETFTQDNFPDDLALICKTQKGLVIILGCAHRGIINTIRQAQDITGEKTVHTVIGGTHLYTKNEEQVAQTILTLKNIGIQNIGGSHCTGLDAAMKLKMAFGDRFFFNNTGSVRIIE